MLRVVGVQPHEQVGMEFVLLQNQGHMRLILRGHAVLSESAVDQQNFDCAGHLFSEEESIAPGLFVMLSSGQGEPHWGRTKDGATVYHTYMGRNRSIWNHHAGPIHVLSVQHTYIDRSSKIEYLVAK
jgi:hypothetical protein